MEVYHQGSKNPLNQQTIQKEKAETWHGMTAPVKPCMTCPDLISQRKTLKAQTLAHFTDNELFGQWQCQT